MFWKLGIFVASFVLGISLLSVAPPTATATTVAPTVSRLSVASGPSSGGTRVTVKGTHLTKVTQVLFGTTPGRNLTLGSATSLRVTAPAHAPGVVDLRIVTAHGRSKAVKADRFRFLDWVRTTLPRPADASFAPQVGPSACWDDQRCVAIGTYQQKSGNDAAVLWTLSGTRWVAERAPIPADAATNPDPVVEGVSCGGAGLCAAHADYVAHRGGSNTDGDLLWSRSRGTWSALTAPLPADADPGSSADVYDVACGRTVCAAYGTYDFAGGARPALWSLTGGAWTVTSATLPADAVRVDLGLVESLACSTGDTCIASGLYLANPGLTSHRALWKLTGSGVTVSEAPPPTDMSYAESVDFGATCGTTVCLATLDLGRPTGVATALWSLEDGAWTRADLPLPTGAQPATGHVLAMSCPASGQCFAVGQYTDSSGDMQGGLWVRSVTGTWTVSRAAVPADAAQDPRTVPRQVTCSDTGTCFATGSYVYHHQGSDIDDEASYDRLQWTYAGGHWSLRKGFGQNGVLLGRQWTAAGSDFCVRFDGFRTLWTLAGGHWRRFTPGVNLAGVATGGGVAFGAFTGEDPAAWVYAG